MISNILLYIPKPLGTLPRSIAWWLEGKAVQRQSSKEDSQLRLCKLFGCHLFPSQFLAKFTLKCAMCIPFELQRIAIPASTTQSAPKEPGAWPKLFLYPCRTVPRIFPTWDWPLDDQLPKRCPSPQNPWYWQWYQVQEKMHVNRACHQTSQIWKNSTW